MAIDFTNLTDVILFIIILLVFGIIIWFFISYANRYEKGLVTQKEVNLENKIIGIFRFLIALSEPSTYAHEETMYKCKYCGFKDNKCSEYCPSCSKNISGKLKEFKCNYCFSISNFYFDYCPKCSRNDKGRYKGGVS